MRDALSLEGVSRFVSFLRRGLATVDDVEEAFAHVKSLFHANSVVLAEGWDIPVWHLSRGVPEQWIRDHLRLAHEDQARRKLVGAPAGMWFCAERDLTREELHTELPTCFRATGLRDAVVVRLHNPFRDDVVFALYREGRRFQPHELLTLEVLYPHLAGAVATRRAVMLLDGSESSRPPFVEVRFPGGEVAADPKARRLVRRHLGGSSTGGWERVERAIAEAARRFSVSGVGGRSQRLWPGLSVDFAVAAPTRGETLRLIGFLVSDSIDGQQPAVPAMVQAVLSPRQVAVVRDFSSGMSITQIAKARGLGVETIRSHLRAAYEKLGVSSRSELARALRSEG